MAVPIPATPPDAKGVLLAAMKAQAGLQGVQIEWAHPGKAIKRETIYFGDTLFDERAAALGNRDRAESYALELIVTVEKAGADGAVAEACERRVWALLAEVAGVLRENADLDGEVRVAEVRGGPVRNYTGDRKRISECVLAVDVTAET